MPYLGVPKRYHSTRFTVVQWMGLGDAMNWDSMFTAKWMSGRVRIMYGSEPMIWRYSFLLSIGSSLDIISRFASIGVAIGYRFSRSWVFNKLAKYYVYARCNPFAPRLSWTPRKKFKSPKFLTGNSLESCKITSSTSAWLEPVIIKSST